ncbi:hypothetical protein GQ55_5G275000 [Panicum hallii var. hallii]|uniref:Uncharacterized protein n=1 Tax=Panicum hallii var. hallii TaxID=1504633 RepID=A0A2T7DKS1_9POAL|nr:hypothetical protein GQ55_5G275000 [Panicum hallii var. hallii]
MFKPLEIHPLGPYSHGWLARPLLGVFLFSFAPPPASPPFRARALRAPPLPFRPAHAMELPPARQSSAAPLLVPLFHRLLPRQNPRPPRAAHR